MTSAAPSQLAQAATELLRRKRAIESLSSFREYLADSGSNDFQHPPAAHHNLIIAHLEALERGEIQRLMILAPPGSAKSTYCSIQFPMWRLARKPDKNILCASNTADLAANFNRRRRNIGLTPQWMALSGTKLASDLQGAEHFGTEREGSVKAAGVGSSIIGTRSHLNVLDDPIRGFEEANSSSTLETQWDWYLNDFRNRLVPGGAELIVATRWAKKDIPGRLLETEGSKWKILRLPMIADRDDDPMRRAVGERLWPEYFSWEHVAERQQNPLMWATQFQQTPLDESGSWVDNEHIKYEEQPPHDLNHVIAVDLALTVGRGDYTVIMVAGIDRTRKIHIVDVFRERVSPEESADKLYAMCEQYQPSEVLLDNDNSSKMFVNLLNGIARQTGKFVPVNLLPTKGQNKEVRAAAIRGYLKMGAVRFVKARWNGAVHHEMLEFPGGDHDDAIDALSLIGRRFPLLGNPTNDAPVAKDPYEGLMVRFTDKGAFLTKTLDDMFEEREDRSARLKGRI